MSHVIGHGRKARETYPDPPRQSGGSAPSSASVQEPVPFEVDGGDPPVVLSTPHTSATGIRCISFSGSTRRTSGSGVEDFTALLFVTDSNGTRFVGFGDIQYGDDSLLQIISAVGRDVSIPGPATVGVALSADAGNFEATGALIVWDG